MKSCCVEDVRAVEVLGSGVVPKLHDSAPIHVLNSTGRKQHVLTMLKLIPNIEHTAYNHIIMYIVQAKLLAQGSTCWSGRQKQQCPANASPLSVVSVIST